MEKPRRCRDFASSWGDDCNVTLQDVVVACICPIDGDKFINPPMEEKAG
jgi:hypothetical protein